LAVAGIKKTNNKITITPKIIAVGGQNATPLVLVKNWQFGAPNNQDLITKNLFPYFNEYKTAKPGGGYDLIIAENALLPESKYYNFKMNSVVVDLSGVPGQNTENPAAIFSNHEIAKINGVYYDPSYGRKYDTWQDLIISSFAGIALLQADRVIFRKDVAVVDFKSEADTTTTYAVQGNFPP
jgi:hypothetical protein